MVKNKVAEAIYEEAATLVWWDIDDCPIPKGYSPEGIVEKIRLALNKLNYRGSERGEVRSNIFGDVLRRGLYNDDNPPPANRMFICREDENYLNMLDQERKMGYNFLVAHPEHPSDWLVASAKTTWLWKSILEESDV
ncbi:hypothetical protein CARUB_v10022465mg [Capsella rubella]|uniref:NYN domain-containing protein n=1 Tax=Capsella rubella TaxID=81985 RepID=R0GG99_9BRAS|nr:hypothetical protein CARUB_v10022465mg [Capsella rubella]